MKRYEALDSMRGLAALTVMMEHLLFIFPIFWLASNGMSHYLFVNLFKYTPLRIFHAGHQAVDFFFVLSGFVLALPFFKREQSDYAFLVKRVFRIYPAYYVTIVLAILMRSIAAPHMPHDVSIWYRKLWQGDLTPGVLIDHFFLLGHFDFRMLDTTIWSLVQEMRIALIFPFLIWFAKRYSPKFVFLISLSLPCMSALFLWKHDTNLTGFEWTPEVMFLFLIGILLAKHKDELIIRFVEMKRSFRILLLVTAFMVYPLETVALVNSDWITPLNDVLNSFGVVVFIWFGISSPRVQQMLSIKPIAHLGKVSYGFYLLHPVVYLSLVDLLHTVVPIWVLLCLVPFVSIGLATLLYRYVEEPFIKLGREVAKKIELKHDGRSVHPGTR